MSARVSRCVAPRGVGPSSQQRKVVLEVDLNALPSDHSHFNEVGPSNHDPVVMQIRAAQQRPPPPPVTIDVDSIDDDVVVLSSPRAFTEAKNSTRRSRSRSNIVDVESESATRDAANNRNKRQRIPANRAVINCESYVNLERSNNGLNGYGNNMAVPTRPRNFMAPSPPPPPPPEPTFKCPICLEDITEETSTKCGHIFCKGCIKTSIATKKECPTCRRKLTQRETFRIYLPKTS